MYVEPDTITEDGYLPYNIFFQDYNKRSTTRPFPKYLLRFSYICSEDYEWELNFDETEMKKKGDIFPKNKYPFTITLWLLRKNGFLK